MQLKQYEKSLLVYRGRKKNNEGSSRYDSNIDIKTQNLKSIHRTLIQKSKHQTSIKPQRQSIVSIGEKEQKRGDRLSHQNYGSMNRLNTDPKNKNQSSIYHSSKKVTNYEESDKRIRSRHNLSVEYLVDTAKIKRTNESRKLVEKQGTDSQKPVNFYINIEKLKNLRISSGNRAGDLKDKTFQDTIIQNGSNAYIEKKSTNNLSIDKRSLILKNSQKAKHRSINASYEKIESSLNSRFITRKKNPTIKPKIRYKTHQNQLEDDANDYTNNPARSHASQYLIPKKSNFRKHEFKDKSFIDGYLKGKQLGRGGFSKVWQGFHFSTKQFYAVKQIDTTNKYQTHLTQIWFGNYFFEHGKPRPQFEKHAGVQKLLKMFEYSIIDPKAFIVYESCDGSLGNMLYDIYQEDLVDDEQMDDDAKMYMIKYKNLYGQLRKSGSFLRSFIKSIAQALDLLTTNKIVHSDIKTENILLKRLQTDKKYEFKLIDYGSSFVFESLKQYKLATPEYMCPQLLNYILFENKKSCHQYMLEYVRIYDNISAIDVWGLGCIVIELIHGLPLWLNNPTKILVKGRYETKKGLFAVSDRSFSKILQRQLSIINNFDEFILTQNNSQIIIDDEIKSVLRAMLNPNPRHRIKPHEIVNRLSQ